MRKLVAALIIVYVVVVGINFIYLFNLLVTANGTRKGFFTVSCNGRIKRNLTVIKAMSFNIIFFSAVALVPMTVRIVYGDVIKMLMIDL